MSGGSVLFYGRRTRSTRSFDDLGFGASSSPSSSSSSSSSDRGTQHHRQRKSDLHRRHRHNHNLDHADGFRRSSHARLPVVATELQQGVLGDRASQNSINNGETGPSVNGRFRGNDRLPAPVLLAKERLLQRLRGVSISGSSYSGEAETSSANDSWEVVASVRGTNDLREQTPVYNLAELPPRVVEQPASRKPNKRFPGLTEETFSKLQHEIYPEDEEGFTNSISRGSNECSICLENFVQGNELISLGCGHRFHTVCLYPWLRSCGECPNCRSCIVATSSNSKD